MEKPAVSLTTEQKKEILAQYGLHETDTGSPEAQVAMLTKRRTHSTVSSQVASYLDKNPTINDGITNAAKARPRASVVRPSRPTSTASPPPRPSWRRSVSRSRASRTAAARTPMTPPRPRPPA